MWERDRGGGPIFALPPFKYYFWNEFFCRDDKLSNTLCQSLSHTVSLDCRKGFGGAGGEEVLGIHGPSLCGIRTK